MDMERRDSILARACEVYSTLTCKGLNKYFFLQYIRFSSKKVFLFIKWKRKIIQLINKPTDGETRTKLSKRKAFEYQFKKKLIIVQYHVFIDSRKDCNYFMMNRTMDGEFSQIKLF